MKLSRCPRNNDDNNNNDNTSYIMSVFSLEECHDSNSH